MAITNSETLNKIRALTMGATGIICLIYGVLAVLTATPNPMNAFIPGAAGIAAMIVITVAFWVSKNGAARQATDEFHAAVNTRALAIGYWVAIGLYPVFAIGITFSGMHFPVAFAAMGTLSGAAYLIPFAYFSLRDF